MSGEEKKGVVVKKILVIIFVLAVAVYADAPWIPNVRVSVDEPWDTLNQGESCFGVYGGLHVTCYHRPSLFSFRYQYSPDAGATFNPGIRVSDTSIVSMDDFIGEYHITQADSEYLYAQWADGRNGDYNDLYFSKALLSQLAITEHDGNEPIVNRILEVPGIWHGNVLLRVQSHAYPVVVNAYDVSGRRVKHIYSGIVNQPMQIQIDHNDFPQGVIFLQLNSSVTNEACKVVNMVVNIR
jgi:hypothetical protein